MNVIFLSPQFPHHFHNFCSRLKALGANVLGIGDTPWQQLPAEVRESLSEYYYLQSLEDYDSVYRAAAFYIHKYGRIDYVESQNEYWLETEAHLRTDFNIATGWNLDTLPSIKLKSRMKEGFARAKVKTARWILADDRDEVLAFAAKTGYPLIVKPDNGVGAANTWKINSEPGLNDLLLKILPEGHRPPGAPQFIVEEYVPGHIETFDGIVSPTGQVVFYTGQVMAVTPLDMLNGAGENVSYTQPVEQIEDLREAGLRTVAAFGVKGRFFHFEFFRLDKAKRGLGKKGDIIGLEVNMRAPGGYIPDKMNYAYDVDVYHIWAEALVKGQSETFKDARFKRYVTHFGRGPRVVYAVTPEEIRQRYHEQILLEKIPPTCLSGGMGSQIFLLKADSAAQLAEQSEYILRHAEDC